MAAFALGFAAVPLPFFLFLKIETKKIIILTTPFWRTSDNLIDTLLFVDFVSRILQLAEKGFLCCRDSEASRTKERHRRPGAENG